MSLQLIPVSSSPNQTLQVAVDINGGVSQFFVYLTFNEIAGYWVMGISDSNQNPLLTDVPLVTGLNLLRQYQYLNIGSVYVFNVTGVPVDSPNTNDLGTDFQLYWGDNTQSSVAA
jgi:hypothetical protein